MLWWCGVGLDESGHFDESLDADGRHGRLGEEDRLVRRDRRSVPGIRSVEEQLHLLGSERHDGWRLDPWQTNADRGVGDDQLVVDGASESRADVLADACTSPLWMLAIGRSPNLSIA